MYTTYTADQAVARAKATTSYETKMCLQFVRYCVTEVPAVLADANAAWAAAKQKVYAGTPPPGAPVYFKGFAHGHIALSLGGGLIRSTDWPSPGLVGTTNINDLCRAWYGTTDNYLGWSRDYAGQIIRGLEDTSTNYSGTPPLPTTSPTAPAPQEDDVLSSEAQQWIEARMDAHDAYIISAIKSQLPPAIWAAPIPQPGDGDGTWPAKTSLWSANTYAYAAANSTAVVSRLDAIVTALPGLPDDADVAALKAQLDDLKALVAALPKAPAV